MALIIEDGSIVAGANSFVTVEEFVTYASERALEIPVIGSARQALLILAVDYIFSVEQKLKGSRVSKDQVLPYPRNDVCANGFVIGSDTIPQSLKNAQMELAIQSFTSAILISGTTQNLASFNVDGVYSETYHSGGSWENVRVDRANAYLNPLFKNNGSANMMFRV